MPEGIEKYPVEIERILEFGKEKEYLTFDDINRLLPPDMTSADEIEAIFDVIDSEGIAVSESDEKFLEAAATAIEIEEKVEEVLEDEFEAEITSGLEKTNDPVRLYLREMAIVPLLTREGEVTIAKRIERGMNRAMRALSRCPICIDSLIRIGEDLRMGKVSLREVVNVNDQEGLADEYFEQLHLSTTNHINAIKKDFAKAIRLYDKLTDEPKRSPRILPPRRFPWG